MYNESEFSVIDILTYHFDNFIIDEWKRLHTIIHRDVVRPDSANFMGTYGMCKNHNRYDKLLFEKVK